MFPGHRPCGRLPVRREYHGLRPIIWRLATFGVTQKTGIHTGRTSARVSRSTRHGQVLQRGSRCQSRHSSRCTDQYVAPSTAFKAHAIKDFQRRVASTPRHLAGRLASLRSTALSTRRWVGTPGMRLVVSVHTVWVSWAEALYSRQGKRSRISCMLHCAPESTRTG